MRAGFAVIAKFVSKPGLGEQVLEVLRGLQPIVENEPLMLCCAIHPDADEPDVVWAYELFTDQAAWDAHEADPAIPPLGKRLMPLLAAPVVMQHLSVDWTKAHEPAAGATP